MFALIRGRTCFVNFLASGSGSLTSIGVTGVHQESLGLLREWSKGTLPGASLLLIDLCPRSLSAWCCHLGVASFPPPAPHAPPSLAQKERSLLTKKKISCQAPSGACVPPLLTSTKTLLLSRQKTFQLSDSPLSL